jgi:hypothetical protein
MELLDVIAQDAPMKRAGSGCALNVGATSLQMLSKDLLLTAGVQTSVYVSGYFTAAVATYERCKRRSVFTF